MALSRLFLTTSLLLFSLLVLASASDYSYGSVPKPDTKESKPQDNYNNDSKPQQPKEDRYSTPDNYKPQPGKPGYDEKKKLVLPTCVEGLVFCKSSSKYIPIKGAVVRITCKVVDDDNECETVYSDETDANGYFFKTLSPLKQLTVTDGLKVIKECKAFLEDSPMEDCKVPTDVNRGISGALLNSYRILNNKNIKLFKVGPFFYTSESQYSDPNNGY
ncbi:hypothetical protein EZV62_010359 [Acer yangbiense]|uniref:Pollen Ole e 1 allergen and extensin family protein n=1 Tax=Acer yangbiense TaxID=1000413 RepID=A0A5C7I2P7_9ROSI|nr:hypothetical protein EZV62_010359 [Acer yangbiense]